MAPQIVLDKSKTRPVGWGPDFQPSTEAQSVGGSPRVALAQRLPSPLLLLTLPTPREGPAPPAEEEPQAARWSDQLGVLTAGQGGELRSQSQVASSMSLFTADLLLVNCQNLGP